eukprot:CAMPEP_0195522012 /NCGR_PEP_ID=MMETSP0794_2-20130614/19881_1 /TAXON_ID=515487 /ORGANISM="Stephanopyxis turris, Strain CCMP 815" /LENGTH=155 /DNA_ID=CAMNT_0040651687 /DNA_START=304 /DNA_END=771 /DNA_ORIENTATION=-
MHTEGTNEPPLWQSINALTLATNDMQTSFEFYKKLGLFCSFGGPTSPFTTFAPSPDQGAHYDVYVNLFENKDYNKPNPPQDESTSNPWNGWGRCVFYVSDVDQIYKMAIDAGLHPEFSPRDADWGERYFHIRDPMGHELSFAKRIEDHPRWSSSK